MRFVRTAKKKNSTFLSDQIVVGRTTKHFAPEFVLLAELVQWKKKVLLPEFCLLSSWSSGKKKFCFPNFVCCRVGPVEKKKFCSPNFVCRRVGPVEKKKFCSPNFVCCRVGPEEKKKFCSPNFVCCRVGLVEKKSFAPEFCSWPSWSSGKKKFSFGIRLSPNCRRWQNANEKFHSQKKRPVTVGWLSTTAYHPNLLNVKRVDNHGVFIGEETTTTRKDVSFANRFMNVGLVVCHETVNHPLCDKPVGERVVVGRVVVVAGEIKTKKPNPSIWPWSICFFLRWTTTKESFVREFAIVRIVCCSNDRFCFGQGCCWPGCCFVVVAKQAQLQKVSSATFLAHGWRWQWNNHSII